MSAVYGFEFRDKTYRTRDVISVEGCCIPVAEIALWKDLEQYKAKTGDAETVRHIDEQFAYYANDEEMMLPDNQLEIVVFS